MRRWVHLGVMVSRPDPDGIRGARLYLVTRDHLPDAAGSERAPTSMPATAPSEDREPAHDVGASSDPDVAAVLQALEQDAEVQSCGGYVERAGYVYDGQRDTYVIACPPAGGQLVRSGEWVRQLWRAYTAGGMTVAECCRTYAIDRRTLEALRRSLALTHTSAPWTDEEIAGSDVAALAADALRTREQRALTIAERAEWRRIKRDAQRWRTLRQSITEAVQGLSVAPAPLLRGTLPASVDAGAWDCLVGTTDLHVGKRTHGEDHSLSQQVAGLHLLLDRVDAQCMRVWQEVPARWIVPVGSDLLHSDSYDQRTTAGTPQGAQSVGSTAQALRFAIGLLARLVDRLAQSAPVLCVHVPGNHDRALGHAVACALEQRYRHTERVHVDAGEAPHRVLAVGRVPLMLHHGDGISRERAAAILRREAPEGTDVRCAIVAHGHLHRRQALWLDEQGLLSVCMASPAGADDWHARKGYTGAAQCIGLWRIHHSGALPLPLWVT